MRLGIILPNWVGDVVMATPALRALRNHLGEEAHLVGLTKPHLAEVLQGTGWLTKTIYHAPRNTGKVKGLLQTAEALSDERLDAILLFTNSLRTATLARMAAVPERIGYRGEGRSFLLTQKLDKPRKGDADYPRPPVEAYLALAYRLGCPHESHDLELVTTAEDQKLCDEVFQRLELPAGDQVVLFNSGSAAGPESPRNWPSEYFADLANQITEQYGYHVLVNCGPGERKNATEIVKLANNPKVKSLSDEEQLPIGLSKEAVRRCRLMISTDSGPRQFARAFDVPVIGLFGPIAASATETGYPQEISLSNNRDCPACNTKDKKNAHRCMQDLSVSTVLAAVDKILKMKEQKVT